VAAGGRPWPDVLSVEARVAGALILAFGWPLLCVRVTWLLLHRFGFATVASHVAAGAAIFLTLSFATMVTQPVDRLRARTTWLGAGGTIVSALVAFVILAAVAGASSAILFGPFALATFVAALAEEAGFRVYLPDRLSYALRRAKTPPAAIAMAIMLIPQLSFAAAHANNSAFVHAGPLGFAALFVAGVLYQGLAHLGGLWAAAAVHAALNLTIATWR